MNKHASYRAKTWPQCRARRFRAPVVLILAIVLAYAPASAAHAQHGDYLLGTAGLLGAQQPPEGILYSNIWSYYRASGGFLLSGTIKCGPLGKVCLSSSFQGSGSLDLFVDQNFFWLVTPFKIPYLDATYGALIDVPLVLVDASGNAAIEPTLAFSGPEETHTLTGSFSPAKGVTKGSIGDIYFEPIDLGWHFRQVDLLASAAFIAPIGPYNANARVNVGSGHWTGLFGAGGILYADRARTWGLSILSHYETRSSQDGRPYVLGDDALIEWGASKTFDLRREIFKQLTIGAVGYGLWQTTDNQIQVSAATPLQARAINALEEAQTRIYSAGPGAMLLTKYGLFALRYYDEFGANATPSGEQLMFTYTVAVNPFN